MKILVDADACPVKEIIVREARKASVPVIMLTDTSHMLNDGYSKVITVDKAADSVDFAMVNISERGDIAVTQDYGLAAMLLSRGVVPVNQNGFVYSETNIDRLLFERHVSRECRKAKKRGGRHRARVKEDDIRFEETFLLVLKERLGK